MPLFAVEIYVDQDELPAIKRAGHPVAGPTQFDWFDAAGPSADENVSNGLSGIRIIVDANDVDQANFKALEEYTWMRERETLSPSDGLCSEPTS
jgi:hypothetical protein